MGKSNKPLALASAVLIVVLAVMIYEGGGLQTMVSHGYTVTTVNQTQIGGTSATQSGGKVSVSTYPVIAGTVSGSGTYAAGTHLIISQTPNHGYVFSNWSCTGQGCYSGTNSSQPLTVKDNIVEVANYKVTITTGTYQGGGVVYGGGNYSYNSSDVIIQAVPNPGYSFSKWVCVGIDCYAGTNSTVSLGTQFPVSQIAQFVQLPPPYNYTSGGVYSIPQGFNYARLHLNGNYSEYVCGGASGGPKLSPGIKSVSWIQLTSVQGYTSSGVNSNSTCFIYTNHNATDAAIVGIGVDAKTYGLYNYSTAPRASFYLSVNNSLLAVIVSGLYHLTLSSSNQNASAFSCGPGLPDACGRGLSFPAPTIDYPQQSNCTIAQISSNTNGNKQSSLAEMFVCNPAVSGEYSVNQSVLYNGSVTSYVFNK